MTDLHWLAASCLLIALFWLPYVLHRMLVKGIFSALDNPNPNAVPVTGWAMRAKAAHQNATENLVLFAPLLLAAHALSLSSATTLLMAQLFFVARLIHFVVYTLGIPVVRTLAFAAGWVATIVVACVVLGLVA